MADENKNTSNAEGESKSAANAEAESKPASNAAAEDKSDNKRTLIIAGTLVAVVAIVAAAVVMILNNRSEDVYIDDPGSPLGYAEGAVALDQSTLQSLVDGLVSDGQFATEYSNDARSTDGRNFSCYIGNSGANIYDMYIQIFADAELTDQLLLTQLLRPGTALDKIRLDHSLAPGTHRVFVFFTQVDDDHATIKGQFSVTMDFTVAG